MAFQGDSIFWVDTEKVVPNPFQPRREFDQSKLQELSESIRMYGVLQPLTVTRTEVQRDDGTFYTEYELIAGERRLRASRLAGVAQVPVIIREGEQNEQEKLELAIIENLQREDLNAVDRALAFQQLAEQFELSHTQVAQKVGRSREYVSNSIRLLVLPDHIKLALQRGELGEGHARTLLMLNDKPQEQETIFREILLKKMSVREVERIVRKIASDKVRKKQHSDIGDHLIDIEKKFTETLGTRVQIQKTEFGGKLTIDYFSEDDLSSILNRMQTEATDDQKAAAAVAMASVAAATPLASVPEADPVAAAPSAANQTPQHHETEQDATADPVQHNPQPEPPVASDPVQHSTQPEAPAAPAEPVVPQPPAPEAHPQPAATPPPAPEPVAHTTPPVAAEHQTPPQTAADPSLLERLAAHTSFGFSRPEPVAQAPAAQPEPVPSQTPEPEPPTAPEYPVSDEHTAPSSAQSVPDAPQQPSTPETEESKDDSADIYSIRNFSI